MSKHDKPAVVANPWRTLGQFTDARIGLGRAGVSLPTSKLLEFQLAHARARDAVHFPLQVDRLINDLGQEPAIAALGQPICLQSRAADRLTYLQRPDLGRQLCPSSQSDLAQNSADGQPADLSIALVDGLSPTAVQQHAAPFLATLLPVLRDATTLKHWRLAPLALVEQGRVAIGDEIGASLNARVMVVIIGERPGLSAPDSLGVYLTYEPKVGKHDAQRNCLSNIRPRGLDFHQASQKLAYLLSEADQMATSGVALKDRTETADALDTHHNASAKHTNFLVPGS
ncbi:ethanolamine ammonia-lyase subunit EutC [Marinobacter sp. CHS3-4]|uniref:ethanolamine ammonia-lyase subunit EutC n=1 Tax=Marinobacter sp. CHS3-4 TaxID=3045174 RepID=UPI0024B4CEA0|nr:ethanolamine ammonia-lyase subunit EutC [Marinobacter sp. CHS3-4]MDI9246388.1 ethanolamine ammonia-lyase subunit EutC [Marinobacter sp. CHS3-4]